MFGLFLLLSDLQIWGEGTVVIFAARETAVYDTHQLCLCTEAEFIISSAEDIVVKNIFDAFLGQPEA